jgi:hypothetical protein
MKQSQKNRAQHLYAQSNLSKTEIAKAVGVSRRIITYWASAGDWDALRHASRAMPTLIAEKLYRLVDGVASSLLADPYALHNITTKQAQTIHLLTTSIKRIKNGCTLGETMEQQNHFLDGLQRRNPTLAEQIVPYIDEYNSCQASFSDVSYPTSQYAPDGSIPFPVEQITENVLDRQDHTQLQSEIEEFLITKQANENTTNNTPIPHNTTHQPPKPTTKATTTAPKPRSHNRTPSKRKTIRLKKNKPKNKPKNKHSRLNIVPTKKPHSEPNPEPRPTTLVAVDARTEPLIQAPPPTLNQQPQLSHIGK